MLPSAGTPVVPVLVTGRPYAIGHVADRLRGSFTLRGPGRGVGPDRILDTPVVIRLPPSGSRLHQVPRRWASSPGKTPVIASSAISGASTRCG